MTASDTIFAEYFFGKVLLAVHIRYTCYFYSGNGIFIKMEISGCFEPLEKIALRIILFGKQGFFSFLS